MLATRFWPVLRIAYSVRENTSICKRCKTTTVVSHTLKLKISVALITHSKGSYDERMKKNNSNCELTTAHKPSNSSQRSGGPQSHMASEGCRCLIFTSVFTSVPLVFVGIKSFLCSSLNFTSNLHSFANMSFCLLSIQAPRWGSVSLSGKIVQGLGQHSTY